MSKLNTFEDFAELAKTRKRKLANNTYMVVRDDGGYGVKLHDTEVVTHYFYFTVLNSGGWRTMTTKDRMNSHCRHSVYSDRGVWMVAPFHDFNKTVPFEDGMVIYHDGTVEGEGVDPKETRRLRDAVNRYAEKYADALIAGEIPEPSGGDCWGCCMVTESGHSAMGGDHIKSHIEENYFVPSILNRVRDELSMMTQDFIARQWGYGEPRRPFGVGPGEKGVEHWQVKQAVRKFCFRELGI